MNLTNLTEEDTRMIMEAGIESMEIQVRDYVDSRTKSIDWDIKQKYCEILTKVFGKEYVEKLKEGKYKNE